MDPQGRIVLPANTRGKGKKYYTCQTEKDGTVHLIPVVGVITAKQAYFWTDQWQQGEKEATQSLRKKKCKVIQPEDLENYLQSL